MKPAVSAASILGLCLIVAASLIPSPAPPRFEIPPSTILLPSVSTPRSPSLCSSGAGLVYADGEGLFFRLSEGSRGLEIRSVQKLIYDPLRHKNQPEKRSLNGWYLDDLGQLNTAVRDRLRRELQNSPTRQAESAAVRLKALADIEGLLEALSSGSFPARRGAALCLGEAGYLAAVPALAEVLEIDREARDKAHRYLVDLTGQDFVEDLSRGDQGAAAEAWRDWFEKNPPAHRFQLRRP